MAVKRVAITGLSLLTPLGCNLQTTFSDLCSGKSGIKHLDPAENPDYSQLRIKIGGPIPPDFPKDFWYKESSYARNDLNSYTLAITDGAVKDGNWKVETEDQSDRFGGAYGIERTSLPCIAKAQNAVFEKGYSGVERFIVLKAIVHIATGAASINYRMRGATTTVVMDSCSGSGAVGEMFNMIRSDEIDNGVAGSADGNNIPILLASFDNAGLLNRYSNDAPEQASRPFDQGARGMVFSDGGAGLLMEDLAFAKNRGAKIDAEVVGFSRLNELGPWESADPTGDGTYRVITAALNSAGIRPEEIDLVSAAGFSLPSFDKSEAVGIKRAFGSHSPAVTAISGALGHLKASSGAVQSVFAVLSLKSGLIPPTVNLTNPIPEAAELDFVTGSARRADLKYAIVLNKGFGGYNTALVIKKAEA